MNDSELEEIKQKKIEELIEKAGKPKIIVYSTPSCPYCNLVKRYLKEHNINFTDYNVAADHEKAKEMYMKSGQLGVPVIDINGKIIIGFNKPAIADALGLRE